MPNVIDEDIDTKIQFERPCRDGKRQRCRYSAGNQKGSLDPSRAKDGTTKVGFDATIP